MRISARIKKARTKAAAAANKAKRYGTIASILLNLIAAGGVIGAPYIQEIGIVRQAASLPGAGLKLQQVAYLSQSIPASQLHEMPVKIADAGTLPDQARKPLRNPFYKVQK